MVMLLKPLYSRRAVRARLNNLYAHLGTWEKVAQLLGLNRGLVWSVANQPEYWPSDKQILVKLGYGRAIKRDLWAMDPDQLRQALEDRYEYSG